MLKTIFVVVLLISSLSSQAAWSYGSSSSSKKKCVAPKITEMQPVNLTKVAPGAAFSFVASAEINPTNKLRHTNTRLSRGTTQCCETSGAA